jgi:hypothetical protein
MKFFHGIPWKIPWNLMEIPWNFHGIFHRKFNGIH